MAERAVLEIVEFRAKAGADEAAIVGALDALLPDLREVGGFVSQDPFAATDGRWLILYRWETLADAQRSAERMAGRASFGQLLALVDPTSIAMTYAEPR